MIGFVEKSWRVRQLDLIVLFLHSGVNYADKMRSLIKDHSYSREHVNDLRLWFEANQQHSSQFLRALHLLLYSNGLLELFVNKVVCDVDNYVITSDLFFSINYDFVSNQLRFNPEVLLKEEDAYDMSMINSHFNPVDKYMTEADYLAKVTDSLVLFGLDVKINSLTSSFKAAELINLLKLLEESC